jgi:hypothetical protein
LKATFRQPTWRELNPKLNHQEIKMGRAKAQQMEHQEDVQRAINLCIEVGAISECQLHEGTYIDSGEYFEAEELADRIINEVEIPLAGFKSKEYLVECVEEAIAMAGEECGSCAKNRDL